MKYIRLFEDWKKERIGQGFEHDVYPFRLKPDWVIKKFIADEELYDLDDWQEMLAVSKDHPDLFAKIGKVDLERGYFVQERLDERSLTRDSRELAQRLIEQGVDLSIGDIFVHLYLNPGDIGVLDRAEDDPLVPKILRFFGRLRSAGFGPGRMYLGDIRLSNLGYDRTGEIKVLDFNFTSEYE